MSDTAVKALWQEVAALRGEVDELHSRLPLGTEPPPLVSERPGFWARAGDSWQLVVITSFGALVFHALSLWAVYHPDLVPGDVRDLIFGCALLCVLGTVGYAALGAWKQARGHEGAGE